MNRNLSFTKIIHTIKIIDFQRDRILRCKMKKNFICKFFKL